MKRILARIMSTPKSLAVITAAVALFSSAPTASACTAIQPCNPPCSNYWYRGGIQYGTATISGGEAHIDTFNPSPVYKDSSIWVMTLIQNANIYAQVGEDHINGNPNDRILVEYTPDGSKNPVLEYGGNAPSGNVDYQVYRDWRDGGMIFYWNGQIIHATDANWNPNGIQNAAEIQNYQHMSGIPSTGDESMGDKSHIVYSNSVSWWDTNYNIHWASLDYNLYPPHADYQMLGITNGNNWSTYDNRCG